MTDAADGRAQKSTRPTRPRAPNNIWKAKFLDALASTGVVKFACVQAGIDRSTYYQALKRSRKFVEEVRLARVEAGELLEIEQHRRGVIGVRRPVYGTIVDANGNKVTGQVHNDDGTPAVLVEYSDRLLMNALRANLPEKYATRVEVSTKELEAERAKLAEEVRSLRLIQGGAAQAS